MHSCAWTPDAEHATSAPEERHEEAEADVDHDGDMDVEHVVLGHMRICCCQLRIPV